MTYAMTSRSITHDSESQNLHIGRAFWTPKTPVSLEAEAEATARASEIFFGWRPSASGQADFATRSEPAIKLAFFAGPYRSEDLLNFSDELY